MADVSPGMKRGSGEPLVIRSDPGRLRGRDREIAGVPTQSGPPGRCAPPSPTGRTRLRRDSVSPAGTRSGIILAAVLALAPGLAALAQNGLPAPPPAAAQDAVVMDVGLDQKLDAQVPLDIPFR